MVGLGWLGLVEFDVDRPRSRATDGHSVNATRKTQNHAVVRHKRSFIWPGEGQNDHDRVLCMGLDTTHTTACSGRARFFLRFWC
jgi:hypothetical protein